MPLAKPNLHGLAVKRSLKWVVSALTNGVVAGLLFNFIFIERKKKMYKNFYDNYDIEKEFETMRRKGLFDSC